MRFEKTKRLAGKLGLLLLALAGAFLSIWSCLLGAMFTGLREGGWNWQFIPFLGLGLIAGVVFALAALVLAAKKLADYPEAKILAVLFGPPTASFVVGAIAFPLLGVLNAHHQSEGRERHAAQEARTRSYLDQACRDPEVVLRDRWLDNWDERRRVLTDNMATGVIPFSEAQLERMYELFNYGEIFAHPACSREMLARHFGAVLERAQNIRYTDLAALVSNPNAPLELVEQVAASTTLPVGAVYPARDALKKRSGPGVAVP